MLRSYKAERRQEERNDVVQQAELYEQLAKERGLDNQATALARLAKNVFKKSFDTLPDTTKSGIIEIKDYLVKSVQDKTLANVLKGLLTIPKNLLNARQKVIQKDLTNPEFKKMLNELMADNIDKSPAELVEIVTDFIAGGEEGKADFDDIIRKSQAIKSRSSSHDSSDSGSSTFSNAPTVSTLVTEAGMGKIREEEIMSMDVDKIKRSMKERGWKMSNFKEKGKEKGAKKNNWLLYSAEYRRLAKANDAYEE
jgi:hypothetical protein